MVIEASRVLKTDIVDTAGNKIGQIDAPVFYNEEARLFGFQVTLGNIVSRYHSLYMHDVIALTPHGVVIDSKEVLGKDLKELDAVSKETGRLLNVQAKTESGQKLGKISDVLLDAETGFIVRFYIKQLLNERIIPRQFLVSISPREVIFKDVVNSPLFVQVATSPEAIAANQSPEVV